MPEIWYTDWANTRTTGYPNWLTGRQHIDHGYKGTLRYVTSPAFMQPPNPGNRKHIAKAEYDDLVAHGIDVWLVYQGSTTDADGGYDMGRRNAQRVVEACTNTKHPSGRQGPVGYDGPVFFTNDRTTLPSPKAWQDYLDGAASVLGLQRVGAYGFGNAMDAALGHATWFWQAGRRSDVRRHVHFWQDNNFQPTVAGILCDRNLVLKDLSAKQGVEDMTGEEHEWLRQVVTVLGHGYDPVTHVTIGNRVTSIDDRTKTISAQISAMAETLGDDEANILAEVRSVREAVDAVDGTPSDEQVIALANQLRAGLGDAVAQALGQRLIASSE